MKNQIIRLRNNNKVSLKKFSSLKEYGITKELIKECDLEIFGEKTTFEKKVKSIDTHLSADDTAGNILEAFECPKSMVVIKLYNKINLYFRTDLFEEVDCWDNTMGKIEISLDKFTENNIIDNIRSFDIHHVAVLNHSKDTWYDVIYK